MKPGGARSLPCQQGGSGRGARHARPLQHQAQGWPLGAGSVGAKPREILRFRPLPQANRFSPGPLVVDPSQANRFSPIPLLVASCILLLGTRDFVSSLLAYFAPRRGHPSLRPPLFRETRPGLRLATGSWLPPPSDGLEAAWWPVSSWIRSQVSGVHFQRHPNLGLRKFGGNKKLAFERNDA